jgi:hypothetical protein
VSYNILRSCLCVLPLAFLVVAPGCGSGSNTNAKISGSVKYKGKPVPGGNVTFFGPDNVPYSSEIDSDGNYSVSDVPAGELVITVDTESLNSEHKSAVSDKNKQMANQYAGKMSPGPDGERGGGVSVGGSAKKGNEGRTYVKIPEKYQKQKTSPLTFTAKSGRNTHDIELE